MSLTLAVPCDGGDLSDIGIEIYISKCAWKLVTESGTFVLQRHSMLKQQDLNMALMVMSREVFSALSQLVPCVGCRRSVERLFAQLTDSGYFALEPLTVSSAGVLSIARTCLSDPRKLYTLFYVHG